MAKVNSPEWKEKISKALKGRKAWNKGITGYKKKPCSWKDKKNISDGVKMAWADGKFSKVDYSKSAEQRKNLSEARKRFYREHPEAAKEHSDKLKGKMVGRKNPNYGKKHIGLNGGEDNTFWKGGVSTLNYRGIGWDRISEDLRKERKKCEVCGTKKDLRVHHKIPYRISKDNSKNNLMVVCNKCHGKIEYPRKSKN